MTQETEERIVTTSLREVAILVEMLQEEETTKRTILLEQLEKIIMIKTQLQSKEKQKILPQFLQ